MKSVRIAIYGFLAALAVCLFFNGAVIADEKGSDKKVVAPVKDKEADTVDGKTAAAAAAFEAGSGAVKDAAPAAANQMTDATGPKKGEEKIKILPMKKTKEMIP